MMREVSSGDTKEGGRETYERDCGHRVLQPVDRAALTELSEDQELALVANPKLLLVTYLVVKARFRLDS